MKPSKYAFVEREKTDNSGPSECNASDTEILKTQKWTTHLGAWAVLKLEFQA